MPTLMVGVRCARARLPETGFTLIEAVVAISVVTVGLLGVFQVMAATMSTNVDASNRSVATHFAARRLEAVRSGSVSDLGPSTGNADTDLTNRLGPGAVWDLAVTDISSSLKSVTVTVRWQHGALDQSVSLSTLAHTAGIASIRSR